jgi:gluconokinase
MSSLAKSDPDPVTIAIVMGVSGCGKTTVAAGLARQEGWILLEGDSFHPPANIAKMKAGTPLTDEDRWPWLRAIAAKEDELLAAGQSAAVACSALKRAYRDILIGGRRNAVLVYLRGSKELIAARLKARKGHFMPPALLDSQFATLEEPGPDEHPIVVDIGGSAEAVVKDAVRQFEDRQSQQSQSQQRPSPEPVP